MGLRSFYRLVRELAGHPKGMVIVAKLVRLKRRVNRASEGGRASPVKSNGVGESRRDEAPT